MAEDTGSKTKKVFKIVIDYSNTQDGYVMVRFTSQTTKRIKAQAKGPATIYTYNTTPGIWEVFPISDGNGKYQVAVFENVSGTTWQRMDPTFASSGNKRAGVVKYIGDSSNDTVKYLY